MKKSIAFAFIVFTLITSIASAHSGRTAPDGCHYDRKTGTRHCH